MFFAVDTWKYALYIAGLFSPLYSCEYLNNFRSSVIFLTLVKYSPQMCQLDRKQ